MKRCVLLLAALAAIVATPAAAQRVLTVYPTVTVPVVQTYGWYAGRRHRAGGWYFQSAISNCQDYPNFISNAAEQCMRRKGYFYAPIRRVTRVLAHRRHLHRMAVRARG